MKFGGGRSVGVWAEGLYRRYASRFFGTVRSVPRLDPRYDTVASIVSRAPLSRYDVRSTM